MKGFSSGGGKEQKGRPASVSTPKSVPSYAKAPALGSGIGKISPNSSSRGKNQK